MNPVSDPTGARFPKSARLLQSPAFSRVINRGSGAADGVLVVNVLPNGCESSRFGITVARRTGNAVCRNRWKRLIREAIRHSRHRLPGGYDVVIRPKRGAVADHRAIRRSLESLVRRAIRRGSPPTESKTAPGAVG